MKAVLISIKPQWCELILNGKKTVEVRKTRPKIKPPFKVYIYCTQGVGKNTLNIPIPFEKIMDDYVQTGSMKSLNCPIGNGKVIGEFVCNAILPISITYSDPNNRIALKEFPFTCLTDKQIMDYLGNGKEGYGWHISDLVIYDNPKELSKFTGLKKTKFGYFPFEIKRPPQSWSYVEELSNA